MATKNLGSASIGVDLDLTKVQADADKASQILAAIEEKANRKAKASGGKGNAGLLGNITDGSKDIAGAIPGLDRLTGSLGRAGQAAGGFGRILGTIGGAAGSAGAAAVAGLIPIAVAIIALVAAIGTAVLAFKGLKAAASLAFDAMQSAANVQAAQIGFNVLARNLGISEGQIKSFRAELSKLDYDSTEQITIMNSLAQALGANGLSQEALEAAKAMRELSVAGGVSSKEGILEMSQALSTLDTTILRDNGVVKTSSQLYDEYAQTHKLVASDLNVTQKQHAILNGIIAAGAANTGTAAAAADTYNRLLVRISSNSEALKSTIGDIFLPLGSGILSLINTEIVGLTGQLQNGENSFKLMGETIKNVVIPILQEFINWVKSLPWSSMIAGIFNAIQYIQIFGRSMELVGSLVNNGVGMMIGGFKILAGGIGLIVGAFQVVTAIVANFWRVLKGEQSVSQALSNIARTSQESFTAAFDKIQAGLAQTTKHFMNLGRDTVRIMDGINKDMGQMISAADVEKWWSGLVAGAGDAAQETLNKFKDSAGGMSDAARKAAQKMAEQLAKENENFARNQAKALRDYERQLAEMVARHRDSIADIRRDIAKETKEYAKGYERRTQEYQDELNKLNKADGDRKNDVQMQIAEELAKGRYADQTKLASLRSRLAYEDAAHKKAVEETKANYETDVNNAKNSYDERIVELQTALDKELAIQEKHAGDFAKYRDYQIQDDITKLKESYVEQRAEAERAHAERIADIIRQGTESSAAAGKAGYDTGSASAVGMAGGFNDNKDLFTDAANQAGKDAADKTSSGFSEKKEPMKNTFKSVLGGVAAGLSIGAIFGPVGIGIGAVIGGILGGLGPQLGEALRQAMNNAVTFLGNLSNFGRSLVGKMGQGIASAFGSIGGAFKEAWNAAGLPRFATGGIVSGAPGRDKVTARLTAGEMVLTKSQQQRMFNVLNGQLDGSVPSGGGGMHIENLTVSLPGVKNATDFERDLSLKFRTLRTGA